MKLNLKNRPLLSRIMIMCFFILTIPMAAQIKYSDGNDSWNPNLLGNHRAVIAFSSSGNIAKTTIEWRRRDQNPELKKNYCSRCIRKRNSKYKNRKYQ
ncbi:glycoside hydrolase domain-containing protein [Flavobacterium sp. CGRL2]